MQSRQTPQVILLLAAAILINDLQAFDVWSYWREKTGQKARVWKSEGTHYHTCPANVYDENSSSRMLVSSFR